MRLNGLAADTLRGFRDVWLVGPPFDAILQRILGLRTRGIVPDRRFALGFFIQRPSYLRGPISWGWSAPMAELERAARRAPSACGSAGMAASALARVRILILGKIERLLEAECDRHPAKSSLAEAIRYCRNQWAKLIA